MHRVPLCSNSSKGRIAINTSLNLIGYSMVIMQRKESAGNSWGPPRMIPHKLALPEILFNQSNYFLKRMVLLKKCFLQFLNERYLDLNENFSWKKHEWQQKN